MPTKFQLITELYDQTVQNVTRSYESWTGFLRAACYNYKCPFDEQILIYAQRPDATAVLEMERWNRRFGRWVNRGAKSIAVFSDDGQNCLKLYFDVSDTHASRFARPLPIWTMQPAFEPEVIETLEATFGDLAEKENLVDAVRSACHNAVADNITDYLQDLCDNRQDKETLATRTRGQTKGRNGSSSTNFQQTGRELMTLGEVRKLGTNQAILFIRGESPVLDEKYNIKNHPNIRLTVDGKAEPYVHKPQGAPNYALPDLPYEFKSLDDYEFINMEESEHEETKKEDNAES